MSYSIFSETMADMTYPQIENAAEQKRPVLFPIAVIEEHGPHMCLGTDTYLTYHFCKKIRKRLLREGFDCIIAPPYYWGINIATNGFAGTFNIKPETMISVLCDLLGCLKTWGFDKIFLFSFHGDFKHNLTIIEAVKKAYEEFEIGAYFIVSDFFIRRARLSGKEPYLIPQLTQPGIPSEYLDLHSGGSETSLMVKDFPELVDIDLAYRLESSRTTVEGLKIWQQGGEKAREITPLGYCGDPSKIDLEAAKALEERMIEEISKIISEFLKGKKVA
jgi:creatinine amidohydrolase